MKNEYEAATVQSIYLMEPIINRMPLITKVNELDIIQKPNVHTEFRLKGIMNRNFVNTSIQDTYKLNFEVNYDGKKVSFSGLITGVQFETIGGTTHVEIKAKSPTILLDHKKELRIFQDKNQMYSDLVEDIVAKYGCKIFNEASREKIDTFTMQYYETDWEFLKRMASRLNTVLITDYSFNTKKTILDTKKVTLDPPRFRFGVNSFTSEVFELEATGEFSEIVKSESFNITKKHITNVSKKDYTFYKVSSYQHFMIGTKVMFQGKILYVKENHTSIVGGLIINKYLLCTLGGFSQVQMFNENIVGISLIGTIIDVKDSKLKVWFDFEDRIDLKETHWFRAPTIYSSKRNAGWYCMPEKGLRVRVYFPDKEESNCYAVSFRSKLPRLSSDRSSSIGDDPSIKSIRNLHFKKINFAHDHILIDGAGMKIKLHDNYGIEISSTKNIELDTTKDIAFIAENITGKATEKISLRCGKNKIEVDKNQITTEGKVIFDDDIEELEL